MAMGLVHAFQPAAPTALARAARRTPPPLVRMPDDDEEKPLPSGSVDWDKEMEVLQRELFIARAEAAYAATGQPAFFRARVQSLGLPVDWQWWTAAMIGMVGACFIEQLSQQAIVA